MMDCDADSEMRYDGARGVKVLWNGTRCARKVHECLTCGNLIHPGTRYHSLGMLEYGKYVHVAGHLDCEPAAPDREYNR